MPIPLVVVGLGAVVVAGAGAAARGVQQHVVAHREQGAVVEMHAEALGELERIQTATNQTVTDYGNRQLQVQGQTIGRFVRWLESHQKLVRRLDGQVVDGIELTVPTLKVLKFDLQQAAGGITSVASAGAAGFSAQAAALWGVGSLASASTGTAISSLSGVAAQNATLAWLGGGPIAAGGAGVAGGTIVLGFIIAAPAAVVAGTTLAWSGTRRRRKVAENAAEARVQIESMQAAGDLTLRIGDRVNELRDVLSATATRTEDALSELEGLDFDPDAHGPQLLRVVTLIRALREILKVAVIDEDGQLTEASIQIVARYR
ncbi:hypothetical protein [Ruania zhangjianzhongii]|uniref:hypothetical protein n=1 Tax=Ruania zhangjianzhongii TaxID=2603206 RepID=UPI0011C93CE8|nr:hypothetical protein [Ruania zhangjianzhongii]